MALLWGPLVSHFALISEEEEKAINPTLRTVGINFLSLLTLDFVQISCCRGGDEHFGRSLESTELQASHSFTETGGVSSCQNEDSAHLN